MQLSAWDTAQDADEFFDAYVKRTERRYKGATRVAGPFTSAPSKWYESQTWRTSEGLVFVIRNSDRVIAVEGLPETADLKKVSAALLEQDFIRAKNKSF